MPTCMCIGVRKRVFSCARSYLFLPPHEVDARNIDGSTPLCDACASGSIECVKLLLSYGAKVNPPLYTASPLHEACMSGESGAREPCRQEVEAMGWPRGAPGLYPPLGRRAVGISALLLERVLSQDQGAVVSVIGFCFSAETLGAFQMLAPETGRSAASQTLPPSTW